MNLLLLFDADFTADGTVVLSGRRARHALEVLGASEGQALRVGKLGGRTGLARVLEKTAGTVRLLPELEDPPPARPGVDVLLAIPRPKALKKVLPALASLGADRIVLVNAARVEKSYFDSKVLAPEVLQELLVLGLEQAKDTVMPEVLVRTRFRPFVEDELVAMFPEHRRILFHPAAERPLEQLPRVPARRSLLAIGPEGGWVPFETELLQQVGFQSVTLGPRPLRVETVLPYVFGLLTKTEPRTA